MTNDPVVEHVEVFDEKGNPTGVIKSIDDVHRDHDWHHGAHVWILNAKGELLLQRRSKESFHSPGLLDPSATGHVSAGESSAQAARRELQEELGIDIPIEDFHPIFSFSQSMSVHGGLHNEFNDVYLVERDVDVNCLKLQEDEVGEVLFMPYEQLKQGIFDGTLPVLSRPENYKKLLEVLDVFFKDRSMRG